MAREYGRTPGGGREGRQSQRLAGQSGVVERIEVAGGLVEMGQTAAPRTTADKLYNQDGDLHWNGIDLTVGGHPAVAAATSVDQSGRTYIQDVTLDSFGHVTGLSSATETFTDSNTTYDLLSVDSASDRVILRLDPLTGSNDDITIIADDTVTIAQTGGNTVTIGGIGDGTDLTLGTAPDESFTLGFKGDVNGSATSKTGNDWTTSTVVTAALDDLNEILGLLVPAKPSDLGSVTNLGMGSTGSYSPRLCRATVPNNSGGSTLTPGTVVARITGGTGTTTTCNDVYDGESGTVSLTVNGSSVGGSSRAMTAGNDNATYGQIVVSDNKWFDTGEAVTGSNTGFWQSYDVRSNASGLSAVGVHRLKLSQTGLTDTDTNDAYFCNDTMTAAPVVAVDVGGESVTVTSDGTVTKSSGINHFSNDAVLAAARTTMTNVANTHYISSISPVSLSDAAYTHSNGTGSGSCLSASVGVSYANMGVGNSGGVVNYDIGTPHTISAQTLTLNGTNSFSSRRITGRGYNVNGASPTTTYTGTNILFKNGTVPNYLPNEDAIDVEAGVGTGSGDGYRIFINTQVHADNDGDSPDLSNWSSGGDNWNSATVIDTSYDAAIVGGVLRHDATDYSDGDFLPVGTDLSDISGRAGDIHYITFRFTRTAVSKFDIELAGEIHATAGCEVALPGSAIDTSATAFNGWLTPMVAYGGSGLPTRGCGAGGVMNPSNATATRYTVTFGTENSTNASPAGTILVRFKLEAGDYLTHLRFRTASN